MNLYKEQQELKTTLQGLRTDKLRLYELKQEQTARLDKIQNKIDFFFKSSVILFGIGFIIFLLFIWL